MSAQANAKISPTGGRETAAVVAQAVAGDRDAFATLYNEHRPNVYRYLRNGRRCSKELAEDLTQDTFVRALRRIGSFDASRTGGGFGAWLTTIARNLHLDYVKSSYAKCEIPFGEFLDLPLDARQPERTAEESSLRALEQVEAATSIVIALRFLNDYQRTVIGLRYLDDLSLPQIADRLGKEPGAVKTLAFRARASMRQALGAEGAAA
ncbi:RNA polymerase sigma factor [Streptomyces sp. NPDC096142]|uniref:RNA polymerase sigma factor n=1 Tax=Streptomyces sp. NPDC096142 TaxID=3366077 RepID=UPI00381AE1BF